MSSPVAPIRQPRGPTSNPSADSFNPPSSGQLSPPVADSDLRRNNTIASGQTGGRHAPSASISASAAASGAFHGGKYKAGRSESRFRSGSLSSNGNAEGQGAGAGAGAGGLARKQSGREVRREEVVLEDQEEVSVGGWNSGLSRQSSLPSRRGTRPTSIHPPMPESMGPPPRPPRRTSTHQDPTSPPAPNHSVTHSLSSLAMVNRPHPTLDVPVTPAQGANVSRTQSLRNQARNASLGGDAASQNSILGRSSSLRQAGEHYRSLSAIASPPSQNGTPRNPFTPPTPPPASSTAALPPFQLSTTGPQNPEPNSGADIKRHQSLGYGRDRNRGNRAPGLLPLDQRFDRQYEGREEEPPTSPIGRSVWGPNQSTAGDDGWSRSIQGVQEAFSAMNFRGGQENVNTGLRGPNLAPPIYPPGGTHNQEEPSWVANLVGGRENSPQPPLRAPSAPVSPWQNGAPFGNQRWPDGQGYIPLNYLQQQQHQQQMMAGYAGLNINMPGFKSGPIPGMGGAGFPMQPNGAYMPPMTPNFYAPAPPAPPLGAQDQEVIELARKKGLNPASFDCRPQNARFFVIKSYTEDDVQKSLKHEIWSSTVLGNKRLDSAFKENSPKGPVYLFFSVNSSRHFCGVAQMLTPVDETQSSTVWAQDKWKGIFKVKWIFVRDVPSTALRHIRLINTTEQKPITNSRDTQEVHYDGGCEVLQIFLDHQNKSKTSLLQDFAYYETMSQNRPANASPAPQLTPTHQQGLMLPPPLPPVVSGQQPMQGMQGMQGQGGYMIMPMPGNGIPPVPPVPARYR